MARRPETTRKSVGAIEEIARRCALSHVTVKQVLGAHAHRYSATTRDRVLEAARAVGYRRNSAARAIGTGRFGAYGLLTSVNERDAVLPFSVLWGMQRAMAERDLHLTVGQLPDAELANPARLPRVLREWSVDGLVISYTDHYPRAMLDLIARHAIPCVWLNVKLRQDCVHPDDRRAGREATEQLLVRGHRRIAFATWISLDHYSFADRYAGYAEAMRLAGRRPRDLRAARRSPDDDGHEKARYFRRLLAGPNRPTAFVTYAATDAEALIGHAAVLGLRVPEDLSVVAIDGVVSDNVLSVATVQLPGAALGLAAIEMLSLRVATPGGPQATRAVAGRFVPGQSIGRGPQAPGGVTRASGRRVENI